MSILQSLLTKAYFPRELPPVFTTYDFGTLSLEIIADWNKSKLYKTELISMGKNIKRRAAYNYRIADTEADIISKPKRGYERRSISLTHPLPQSLLAKEISDNWPKILKWIAQSKFSEDRLTISQEHERGIKEINFEAHRAKKSYIEACSDWVVKTDITGFYPSIYTHSIAWAAYGKERVKKDLRVHKGSLADRLDQLLRACNRNQTVGVPTGPETSRIIADIISSRIDRDFSELQSYNDCTAVDRLQDDWHIGTGSFDSAERILSSISHIYRAYSLEINGGKTSIENLIAAKDEEWQSKISAFLSHGSGSLAGRRLSEFLRLALRLQQNNRNAPVINYTLAVIENTAIAHNDLVSIETFLLKAAVISPISLDRICRIVLNIQYNTKGLSKKRIADRFVALAERSLEKGFSYEAIWYLYTVRGLRSQFNGTKISALLADTTSSPLALLSLDMHAQNIFVGKLPRDDWQERINEENILRDGSWLLAYEAFRKGWMPDPFKLLNSPFFEPMHKRDVVFYNPRRNIMKSSKALMRKKVLRRRDKLEATSYIWKMRWAELYTIHGDDSL